MTSAAHTHRNDLTSLAFDPAGTLLATGSGTPPVDTDDFYDAGGRLVLFSVATHSPIASIDVQPGGVGGFGAPDCLVFNPSGSLLLMSHATNQIATLDPRLGLLRVGTIYTELNDGFPGPVAVAWVDERNVLLMSQAVVPALGDVTDYAALGRVVTLDPFSSEHIFSLGPRIAHGIALALTRGHQTHPPMLIGIDVAAARVAYSKVVAPYVGPEHWFTTPDGTRTLYVDESTTAIFEGRTGDELARTSTFAKVAGGVAAPRGDRWALFGADLAWLVSTSGATQRLAASALRDPWLELPDAGPLAFAPRGDDLVLLQADGRLERRSGPDAAEVVFTCAVGEGERAVRWPCPETLVTFGRRRIVFRDARDGAELGAHAW